MSKESEPEPTYFGTAKFAGYRIELYRTSWMILRTRYERWYAKLDGMSNDELHETRSERPQGAIGLAILNLKENDQLAQKIWS